MIDDLIIMVGDFIDVCGKIEKVVMIRKTSIYTDESMKKSQYYHISKVKKHIVKHQQDYLHTMSWNTIAIDYEALILDRQEKIWHE